ncbi:hypothetical protein R6Q59_026776 [Mikania micrantha]
MFIMSGVILFGVSLGSKEVVHVHSTLSKQSVLKRKSRVRFDVSGQMKVDAPSFSLGMTQEGLEKPVMETPVEGARKKPLEGPSFSLGMTQDESEAPKTDDKKSGKLDVDKTEARRNPTRLKVVSRDCKSPFVQREVVIKNRYTSEEKAIWKLIFAGDNERKETQRVVWDKVFETVSEEKTEIFFLQTLEPGKRVYGNIIDCWAAVLNDEERLRSAGSPHRLFCGHRIFVRKFCIIHLIFNSCYLKLIFVHLFVVYFASWTGCLRIMYMMT